MNSVLPYGKNDEAIAGAGQSLALLDFEGLAVSIEDAESEATRRVVYGYFLDLSELDAEHLVLHYAADCKISDDLEVWEGKEAIRLYYRHVLEQFAGLHTSLRLLHFEVQGKMAFLTWEQYNEQLLIPFGSTTFIVWDGLIRRQQLIACACGSGVCIHLC